MKVLISAYACEPHRGSEPNVGWNWVKQMARFHEIWVLTRANNRAAIESARGVSQDNIHFDYLDFPKLFQETKRRTGLWGIRAYYALWQMYSLRRAYRLCEQRQIDVAHHATMNGAQIPSLLPLLPLPVVWGPIGGGQTIPKGFELIVGSRRFEIWREKYTRWFFRSSIMKLLIDRSASVVIANRESLSFMPHNYGLKYHLMLDAGIDGIDRRGMVQCTLTHSPFRLLWVGGIYPRKALPLAIYALHSSKMKGRIHLTVVGDGPDRLRNERLAAQLGVSDFITFTGWLTYSDVQQQYLESDAFLFTSLRDTSGNVVLEAMSYGLPVIVPNHQGAADMVTANCGIRIPVISMSQYIRDLSQAIDCLVDDSSLRQNLGAAARQRVKDIYDWDRRGEEMNQIYHTASASHQST